MVVNTRAESPLRRRMVNNAARLLLQATQGQLILLANKERHLFMAVSIDRHNRMVYEVSNGLPGDRTCSEDFVDFYKALACFNDIVEKDWTYNRSDWPYKNWKRA